MQNRVLPFSLAFRAASRTGSSSTRRDAFVEVEWRDDCEQYEPVERKKDNNTGSTSVIGTQNYSSTHSLLYIRQLPRNNIISRNHGLCDDQATFDVHQGT